MEMLEHYRRLFAYDDWANREMLASFRAVGNPPERARGFLAHIFAAERLWLERLKEMPQSLPVWPQFDLEQCQKQANELPMLWSDYLRSMPADGLNKKVLYKNTKGESFSSRVEDILMHVIMHAAYHRGQIATDMRAAGFTPAYTDFIHGVRQGFVK